jgi:hypothetical protein
MGAALLPGSDHGANNCVPSLGVEFKKGGLDADAADWADAGATTTATAKAIS